MFSSTKQIKGDRRLPTAGYAIWINYGVSQLVKNGRLNTKFYNFKLKSNLYFLIFIIFNILNRL
jgi:hypothetical protein